MKILLAVFLATISLKAFAQVESGTFIALNSSQNEIVVAADSRAIGLGTKFDNNCKISALGNDLIFAAAGKTAVVSSKGSPLGWDAHTIARNLFLGLDRKSALEPMPIRLANAWGDEIKKKLKVDIVWDRRVVSGKAPGSDLISAVFAGFDQNAPLIVVGTVTYTVASDGTVGTSFLVNHIFRSPQSLMLGNTEIADELATQRTPRAIRWKNSLPFSTDQITSLTIGEVEFSIENSPLSKVGNQMLATIAGPIDAVELTKGLGIKWLHRKPSCQNN